MKDVSEITVGILDYGTFQCLAEAMGKVCEKVYYYTPNETEYRDAKVCCIGDGFDDYERVDEYATSKLLSEVDLWICPDIGWGEFQKFVRDDLGKAVWGAFGADELELYRTQFLDVLKELGLPVTHSVTIRGLTKLAEHLKGVNRKWVKVNRYRANMETWFHSDWDHSQRELERLALEFGGVKEMVVFVVQDEIETTVEIGYDGWSVDGEFPEVCYQGYEKKNELYLGSEMAFKDMPKEVQEVNQRFGKVLKEYGYRNFFATELRKAGDKTFFIDPTLRMAGQTMEHQTNTCANLSEVIWQGANGNLIKPKFKSPFAAEATMHYTNNSDGLWRTIRIPKKALPYVKPTHCCCLGDTWEFPPGRNDEVGVVVGNGKDVEETIMELKDNFDLLKNEPLSIRFSGFADLIGAIEDAEKKGMEFSDKPLPDKSVVIES